MSADLSLTEQQVRRPRGGGCLLLFLLIVALIAINALYQPALNQETVLEGSDGELLYIATFDGFQDEWQEYTGSLAAQIVDDSMQLTVGDTQAIPFSVAKPHFADFDATMKIQTVDNALDNAYGLVFRLQQVRRQDCTLPGALLCDLATTSAWFDLIFSRVFGSDDSIESTDYYMFLISNDGYYSVRRGGEDGEHILSAWIQSPFIQQGNGEINTIRVIGEENEFRFFVNGEQLPLCVPDDPGAESIYFGGECVEGQMVDTLVDDTVASGQIGVIAQTFDEAGLVVAFDELMVFSPGREEATGDQL